LVIPRAEASPRRVPEQKTASVSRLRSEGKQHALERMADGIVVVSEERGAVGFLKSPAQGTAIRWAGFVEGDAILVATSDALYRAATPDDAIAGTFEALEKLDPAATMLASAGKVVVAAAPGAGGAFYESRDGGKHFAAGKRPASGPIADLAVRADGVIVVAIEKEPITDAHGQKGLRAEVHVRRGAGAWSKGPLAEATYDRVVTHRGDSITVLSPAKPGDKSRVERLGLDAKGKWVAADYPGSWLGFTWTNAYIEAEVPVERPGFPKPPGKEEGGLGLLGGLFRGDCRGFECLGNRSALGAPPPVRAFHDGQCDKGRVVTRTEKVKVLRSAGQEEREESHSWDECDPKAPVKRASTLVVREGEHARLARLPITCAAGRVVGTDRASFVYCSAKHAGRPSIHAVSPSGALAEVVSSAPDELEFYGAESVSDGTTVLFADKGVWVCRAGAACASVVHEGFLAARPLPGGRALVVRRGARTNQALLDLFGEPGAAPFRISAAGNVLEVEITAEGYIRLWTSPSLMRLESPESLARRRDAARIDGFLVRGDGKLVPDPAAKLGP
jgi:hypothetical protein